MSVCAVGGCGKPHVAQGYCGQHYARWRRHGSPTAGRPAHLTPAAIEDIEWMVETGESLTGAAKRCQRSVEALERALGRAGRRDLTEALASREGNFNASGRVGRYGAA